MIYILKTYITLSILKLLRFNSINDEQAQNILFISVILSVLKLLKFNDFNDEQL